jgi:hypothetical protein
VIQKPNDKHKLNCSDCGKPARLKFYPTPFKFKFFYGWNESLGKYCDTEKDKKNYMRENNLIEQ